MIIILGVAVWLAVSAAVALVTGRVLRRCSRGYPPDPAADDELAAGLAAALRAQRDAGPVARSGRDAWQQREGSS